MKILLAADGSECTRRAVKYLVTHLKTFGDGPDVCLLHVQPPIPGRAASAVDRKVLESYYGDEHREALARAARTLKAEGVRHRLVGLVGDPGGTIAGYAARGRFDLIVLGSHGRGALGGLVLGSVVRKVLAGCKVPALIVR